jgi:RNA polymerase sigma-70 factor, ECF subfamily
VDGVRVDGPAAALTEVELLEQDRQLRGYHLLPAARADLLSRLGRTDEAKAAYRHAAALTTNEAERLYLTSRAKDIRTHT